MGEDGDSLDARSVVMSNVILGHPAGISIGSANRGPLQGDVPISAMLIPLVTQTNGNNQQPPNKRQSLCRNRTLTA
jgi:hypothetical protein